MKIRTIIALLVLFLSGTSHAITYNIMPQGIPDGLDRRIKGNFRIIEHDTTNFAWLAYDCKSYKKSSDGLALLMQPPIYRYVYEGQDKWSVYLHNTPIDTFYRLDLVTVIRAKSLKQQLAETADIKDNLPAMPLDSKEALYKLLRANEPIRNQPSSEDKGVQAKFWVDFRTAHYRRAGYSFERTIISFAKAYKANRYFHNLSKYDAAKPVWGDVHGFSDYLADYPYQKYFSKQAYQALETIRKVDEDAKGKKIK